MLTKRTFVAALLAGAALIAGAWCGTNPAAGAEAAPPPGAVSRVDNIKVVSDKIEDVTTVEAWKDSFIKPGMTDKEKALIIWESCVKFRQQDSPPNEWTENEGNVRDPIKTFNVYGYGMCGCVAADICALGRHVGLKARGKGIGAHAVPELWWDNDWHLLDASLINYFTDDGGDVASVDEIIAAVGDWLGKNPGYKGDDAKLRQFHSANGWTGWKNGPPMLARCPFYGTDGWWPARTHGWYSTMQEYDGSRNFVYEYGYSMGYRALFGLRPGESLARNWSNKGLHVNMYDGEVPGSLTEKVGAGQLAYAVKYGDLAPGRIGNGVHLYRVPLGDAGWRSGAWSLDNVAAGKGMAPALKDKPAEAVFRMRCPYVILKGRARIAGKSPAAESVKLLRSTNNGLDYNEIWKVAKAGDFSEEVDLGKDIIRRYDVRLKLVLSGDAAVTALDFENDIQHSQRALPALAEGKNTITVSGGEPTDTVTISGAIADAFKNKNEVMAGFRPSLEGVKHTEGYWCADYGKDGLVTFPVETPGDIKAIRFGGHFRARGARDGIELLVSFDGGGAWKEAGKCWGPYPGTCYYVDFNDVPAGSRKALVRYKMTQKETVTGIFNLRIDADYWDTPDGKPSKSLVRPLKVTYVWEENGAEKRDVHTAAKLPETYTISCASKPLMKSITVELAE